MVKQIDLRERLIVALDFACPETARKMVLRCEPRVGFFKIGLELFMADWFHTVDWLIARGHKVMLDLKFFDIPETVKRAVERINQRGVSLLTVHGNESIVKAAVGARGDVRILAVTVLTSFSEEDMQELGMTGTIGELVRRRARTAFELGCAGVVSSGQEAEGLRRELGEELLIVTPGIRPVAVTEKAADDQKRVMTAGQAIGAGADHLVVGRPITRSDDPLGVIERMQQDITRSLAR